jgi:hypothetical protein
MAGYPLAGGGLASGGGYASPSTWRAHIVSERGKSLPAFAGRGGAEPQYMESSHREREGEVRGTHVSGSWLDTGRGGAEPQ